MKILFASDPNFNKGWDRLCHDNLLSPIYFSSFFDYFKEVHLEQDILDLSLIVLDDGEPLMGSRILQSDLNLKISTFNYFGNSAIILNGRLVEKLEKASEITYSHYKNLGFFQRLDIEQSEWSFNYISHLDKTSVFVENLLKKSPRIDVSIERVLDLQKPITELKANLSKSAKKAIREALFYRFNLQNY